MMTITESTMQDQPTEALKASPKHAFRARYDAADITGAVYSAARAAMRDNRTYYVYAGNSYMNMIYRVTWKKTDALNFVNCTGTFILQVDPDLTVTRHDIDRGTMVTSSAA